MSKTKSSNNPIGNQKPHAFLQNMIRSKYRVVLEVHHSNGEYHVIRNGKKFSKYCIVSAYNNVDDLKAGRNMIATSEALCSDNDNYNRHLGLTIALRRLNILLKETEKTEGWKFNP